MTDAMNWPTFDIAHGGVTYSIPYSRISLTEASIDGDTLKYTLTVGQQEDAR